MEESGINQSQGNQTAAATQLLATTTGDSDSQRNTGEDRDEAWRDKKRKNDKRYRDKQRDTRKALEDENDRLRQEIQEKDKQEQLMKSKLEVVEAENARLKHELEEKKELTKSLLGVIGAVNQRQISPTNMEPLLDQIKLVVNGFVSLNQKVDEVQQYITQPPGTHVYAQPPWQPQHSRLINQSSQAAATTLLLTQPVGTSRMQQTSQSPGTFTGYSYGIPDSLLQELLGETAPTTDVSPEFSLQQGQGGNTAVQPFTQGPSDQDDDFSELLSFYETRTDFLFFGAGMVGEKKRKHAPVHKHARSTEQTILSPFTKEYSGIAASLAARNDSLKPEIQERQELCQEEEQMKSNIGAFEADNKRLKGEIKEKERRLKFNLRAFLVDYRIFMDQIEAKEIVMMMFEGEKERLEHKIEEKERLIKSNMEAFESKNGHLKLEIGEKEQPTNSNLEVFEAQNERLKREMEEKKQLMKSNLETFEARNGKLEHEIQAKEQLVKSNLETLELQIRQLVDEFESLNVANFSEDLRMQAHLEINFDKLKLN